MFNLFEYLTNNFEYREGALYWRVTPFTKNQVKQGDRAGWDNGISRSGRRYRRVEINGKCYYEHKLIYMFHTGEMPEYLDHIDNDSLNNKIENLRPCTHQQNMLNKKMYKNNTSGIKGVFFEKDRRKWKAVISVDKKQITVGRYNSMDDAIEARKKAETKHYNKEFYSSGEV
jgi:hypothetical protein